MNIGNANKVKFLDFIDVIEEVLGKKAIRNLIPMQKGDVTATWADNTLFQDLTGYVSKTKFNDGVARFDEWYKDFYKI